MKNDKLTELLINDAAITMACFSMLSLILEKTCESKKEWKALMRSIETRIEKNRSDLHKKYRRE